MNQNLQKVIKVLKYRGVIESTNNQELARLSGLVPKTITRSKEEIKAYTLTAPEPTDNELLSIDKKLIENYIEMATTNTNNSKYYYANILGAIAGYVLRQETDLINKVQQPLKVINIGIAFMNLASQITSKKNTKQGRPIHSRSKYVKYLLDVSNELAFIDKLFVRSSNYRSGMYSKNWRLSTVAEDIIKEVVDKTIQWIGSTNVPVSPAHIGGYICSGKSGTSSPIPPQCFSVGIRHLSTLSLTSLLHILNYSEPSTTNGFINVTLENLSSTDATVGRDYNIFTRLRSTERKQLDYINYDISGGIQAISFGILLKFSSDPNTFEKYPMLFEYASDQYYKKKLRSTISTTLGISTDDVKSLLTAYANGSTKDSDKDPNLQQFAEESDLLRKEVIAVTAQHHPDILKLAQDQSKREFPEDLDWMAVEEEDPQISRDKSSVYFFIWTYYEKQIRDAMLSVVSDGIPVHDAIYSKQQIPCSVFEQAVLDQTGFEVKISH